MSRIKSLSHNLRLFLVSKITNPIELLKEVNLPTDNRGDNIFALARKTSEPIERYPKELYVD